MFIAKTLGLFVATAVAEIVGCYLPYLWLKKSGSTWLLLPAAASLALFAWLLSLHPTATGPPTVESTSRLPFFGFGSSMPCGLQLGIYSGSPFVWLVWLSSCSVRVMPNKPTAPYCRPLAVLGKHERTRLGGKR